MVGGDNAVVLLPGTVAAIGAETCVANHPVEDVRAFFAAKEEHLIAYAKVTGGGRSGMQGQPWLVRQEGFLTRA